MLRALTRIRSTAIRATETCELGSENGRCNRSQNHRLDGGRSSDDGEHVWITHRLGDGSEYPLVYPYEAVGYLITVLTDAARSASRRRSVQNPAEAGEGLNTNVIAVEEVRVGTSPETSGAILHLTTADSIPIAVEIPVAVLGDVVEQLQHVLQRAERKERSGRRLH